MIINKPDYAPGVCTECGAQFIPSVSRQKICLKTECKKSRAKRVAKAHRKPPTRKRPKGNVDMKEIREFERARIVNKFLLMPAG